jgi:thioredoxin-related protein
MFTLDDDTIKELIKKSFTYVHINISENDIVTYKKFKGSGHDFAKHVGYNFYPSSLFLDEHNEMIYAIPGYQEEDKFLNILRYIDTGAYKTTEYKDFKYNRSK